MARANQLRLTTKLARQVGRNSIYEPARIKPRGGKKRAVTLVAPFISHHLQLQYPDRYTDLFACYEMRAITFANMRRHIHIRTYIHTCICIYVSISKDKHFEDDFSFFFLFLFFVREILQIIIMSRLLENNCGENHKRRLRRSVRLIRFPVVKSP